MKEKLQSIKEQALSKIAEAQDINLLNDIKVSILGKKGELTQVLKSMKDVAPEDRPKVGQMVNETRANIEAKLEEKMKSINSAMRAEKMKRETIDVTLPGVKKIDGHRHPNQIALEDLERVFIGMGYEIVSGPEIEYDKYNFELLNIPANHPAKDEQDTFYITKDILLRTQTSPVQARIMEQGKLPIRILSPGRVFRSDSDATHSPMFHQMEGLVIDKNITLCDLQGMLDVLVKRMFSKDVKTRFRPSFFPFTEPSVEVDVSCFECGGKGCKLCKGTGWIEILGGGIVNRRVLQNCDVDPNEWTGFAFGFGLDRIAMLKNGINNIRVLYEGDLRALKQFKD